MLDKMSRRDMLKLGVRLGGATIVTALAACAPAQAPSGGEAPADKAAPPKEVELRFVKLAMGDAVSTYFNDKAIPPVHGRQPGGQGNRRYERLGPPR